MGKNGLRKNSGMTVAEYGWALEEITVLRGRGGERSALGQRVVEDGDCGNGPQGGNLSVRMDNVVFSC